MPFLTAEWRKLAFANYPVDPAVLQPYVPFGTELDFWQGRCYLSLVGFLFTRVRLLGIPVPFHTEFEEVNIRFYVRRKTASGWKRGVVFIREIVPKAAITFVANTVYNENYQTLPMRHRWINGEEQNMVEYQWKKAGNWQTFSLETSPISVPIQYGSEEEFITEHYWGYAAVSDQKSNEYEVTHPRWQLYPVHNYTIEVDYGLCYGPEFSFLNSASPTSVFLAEGSAITVEPKAALK
ncbi:YqjF family protein [Neolewinella agarilytica]|uniref:YqjF family protein n=1 Tax=Neolewinella agarilytica TaxID=478744 RepID=UPI002353D1D2|nr:DUF2071 domain-containing protein [Neolewinella agarilytica]